MEGILWLLVAGGGLWIIAKTLQAWNTRRRLLRLEMDEVDQMSGAEFEQYVTEIMKEQGWKVDNLQHTGDFGADLIGQRQGRKVAIQCKRIQGTAGVEAVQDAISGRAYYKTPIKRWSSPQARGSHNLPNSWRGELTWSWSDGRS